MEPEPTEPTSPYAASSPRADPAPLETFVPDAAGSDFPIQNLPYGVFVVKPDRGLSKLDAVRARVGVAIGSRVLDLSWLASEDLHVVGDRKLCEHKSPWLLDVPGAYVVTRRYPIGFDRASIFSSGTLTPLMRAGAKTWRAMRARLQALLALHPIPGVRNLRAPYDVTGMCLYKMEDVEMRMPCDVGDFTDFYASREHATNVGTMFRGASNALNENWAALPVGYHGRASSVVCSGTNIVRPRGQILKDASSSSSGGTSEARPPSHAGPHTTALAW